jgi:hypothetical protein
MDMQVDPLRVNHAPMPEHAPIGPLNDTRIDQLMRWHGTDETNLPPADTLRHLSRDTLAALHELRDARATITSLRTAMGRAFWTTDFRALHALLLQALGPPPPRNEDDLAA